MLKRKYLRSIFLIFLIFIFLSVSIFQVSCINLNKDKEAKIKEVIDLFDLLILYDSKNIRESDINFIKISEYAGLKCKKIDIENTKITENIFFDSNNDHYKAMYINSYNLENDNLLDKDEIKVIRDLVTNNKIKLLICDITYDNEQKEHENLKFITDNAGLNISEIKTPCNNWNFSNELPLVTKEFTNKSFESSKEIENYYSISTPDSYNMVNEILYQIDEEGKKYPIFINIKKDIGEIFIESGNIDLNLNEEQMYDIYNVDNLSILVPMMMFIKYALDKECWHHAKNYANLTIDDPYLSESFSETLSYYDLLDRMKEYDFHATIGFIPRNWHDSDKDIVELFRENEDSLSLVVHGNNHDGYEFYKYSIEEGDEHRARPIKEQESDIIFGLFQMKLHEIINHIPFGRIMIFPYGISPEDTLELLKKYNFIATVNAQDVPLDSERSIEYDYNMYQAIMDYANFAVIKRRSLSENNMPLIAFDSFIDKPVLYYTHVGENFISKIELIDKINSYGATIEWKSLDYIIKHLYLEKLNDDGSIDVKIYCNNVIISNDSESKKVYHIRKEENLNVPIKSIKIDNKKHDFDIIDEKLCIDTEICGESNIELVIEYGPTSVIGNLKERLCVTNCVLNEILKKLYIKALGIIKSILN